MLEVMLRCPLDCNGQKPLVGVLAILLAALGYQFMLGKLEFLPKSDYGTLAIEVRTPSSTSIEYSRSKVEKAAELARQIPEVKFTNSRVNPTGCRVWVDVGSTATPAAVISSSDRPSPAGGAPT